MHTMKRAILFYLLMLACYQQLAAQSYFKNLAIEDYKIKTAFHISDLKLKNPATEFLKVENVERSLTTQSCFKVGVTCAILPVKLLAFTATRATDEAALIKWETTEESNLKGYFIERSINPSTGFLDRGFVVPKNNGAAKIDYQFSDPNDLTVVSYYRLRMLDLDGSYTYSEIKPVEPVKESNGLVLFPNPTADILNLRLKVIEQQRATVFLFDAAGREIKSWKRNFTRGTNMFSENISSLSAGSYYIVVRSDKAPNITVSFFKN